MIYIGKLILVLTLYPACTAAACLVANCGQCDGSSCLICNVCHDGYYLDTGSCIQCPTYCATCTNSTHCQTCLDRYMFPEEQCRFLCGSDCTAAGCNDTTGNCYECKPGLYGRSCDRHCSECVEGHCDRQGCTKGCKDGYFLYKLNLVNTGCEQCSSNCITCLNETYCTHCEQGYYGNYYGRYSKLRRGSRDCVRCDKQCTECNSIDQCPEWCPADCIQQGCAVSGNCDTTTPTPTNIKFTSTSTVCPTECMGGCDSHGRCHETTSSDRESDGSYLLFPDDEPYYKSFSHGAAISIGVIISMAVLDIVGMNLTIRIYILVSILA